jgi:hypothetical protein
MVRVNSEADGAVLHCWYALMGGLGIWRLDGRWDTDAVLQVLLCSTESTLSPTCSRTVCFSPPPPCITHPFLPAMNCHDTELLFNFPWC